MDLAGSLIQKKDTNLRKAISAAERLMLTMQFLASGDLQVSLSYLFLMGKKSVSRNVSETSKAIIPSSRLHVTSRNRGTVEKYRPGVW